MAADLLGFQTPSDAMHEKVMISDWREVEIIGVLENHHQRSLHHPVIPIIHDVSSDGLMTDGYYTFELEKGAEHVVALQRIEDLYRKFFPHTVFDPIDIQSYFASQYESDDHFKKLNLVFTILGFFISFLGLLGLMMITVGKRSKEIGIRKILGATHVHIVGLLFSDFVLILLGSTVIATIASYFLMNQWLQNFTYRIDISWWIFIAAAVGTSLLVFLAVGYMSLRAARVNPAETLRE